MNALIIGGTRNLGPSILASLVDAGFRLTVFNRGLTAGTLPPGIERLTGDRSDPSQLTSALAGRTFDVVVDTTLYNGTDAEAITRILRGRVRRYVFLSTGQVYLVRVGVQRPFSESDYPGPVLPSPPPEQAFELANWNYGIEKRAAEDAFTRAHEREGFPFISLRLPMVNSERDNFQRILNYISRLRDGGPILVPIGERYPLRHVYGEDVIQAIRAVATGKGSVGTAYNISQDDTLEFDDFLRMLAGLCGGRAHTVEVPLESLVTRGLVRDSSPFTKPWMSALDNALGKGELGLRYTPYETYLPKLVEYHAAQGNPSPTGYEQRPLEIALAREVSGES